MLVRFRLCFSGKACQSRSTAPQCRSVHMLYFPITVGTNMVGGMGKACLSCRTTVGIGTLFRIPDRILTGTFLKISLHRTALRCRATGILYPAPFPVPRPDRDHISMPTAGPETFIFSFLVFHFFPCPRRASPGSSTHTSSRPSFVSVAVWTYPAARYFAASSGVP